MQEYAEAEHGERPLRRAAITLSAADSRSSSMEEAVKPFVNLMRLFSGLRAGLADGTVQGLLALTFALVLVASIVYSIAEGWSFLDSTYFAVVTIATIGYGDLAPKTAFGKLFTIAYVISGIGIFVTAAGALGEHIARKGRQD
jgi:voltage-gated potassium channel